MRDWLNRDTRAFEALVARHGRSVKGYALRMLGNAAEAEDVYAETFMRLARRTDAWKDTGTVRGWLFTIARRLCIDELRQRKRFLENTPGLVSLEQGRTWTPSPEARAILGDRIASLERALGRLNPTHRDVVLLRLVHGFSAKETAGVLECTPQQVDSRLAHARRQLKRWLSVGEAPSRKMK